MPAGRMQRLIFDFFVRADREPGAPPVPAACLQADFHGPAQGHGLLRHPAVIGKQLYAVAGGAAQSLAELRVRPVVGRKIADVFHLDHKQQPGAQPGLGAPAQLQHVADAALCGRVREIDGAVLLQRNALDLQIAGLAG